MNPRSVIKRLKAVTDGDLSAGHRKEALREVCTLQLVGKHKNVVELIDVGEDITGVYLVFALAGVDMRKHLQERGAPTHGATRSIWAQLAHGISHIHGHGVIHRDLSLKNILVAGECEESWHVRVSDFGSACLALKERQQTPLPLSYVMKHGVQVCTLWYRPPEILAGSQAFSEAFDIWSLGCIFCELAINEPLFRADTEDKLLKTILRKRGSRKLTGLETMPLWPSQTPKIAEAPWPQEVYSKVGLAGVDLLCGMLDLGPVKRMPIIDSERTRISTRGPYSCLGIPSAAQRGKETVQSGI